MGNTLACFEVTSDSIRLVLGYEEDRAPVLLYKSEMAIPDIISGGVVKEEDALVAALSKFHKIVDDHVKLDLTITTVNVVLPSIGFLAFRGAKTTNTVSPSVTAVDVSNVISLLQKEAVKDGYSVIDIIPQEFILDDGRRFYEPPIGETSSTLTVNAFVHVLPSAVASAFQTCFLKAGFRIERVAVSSYCEGLAVQREEDLPKDAIVLNLGARITNVNLLSDGMTLASEAFYFGGDDVTDKIVDGLGVSYEEAEALKKKYGYDPRHRLFDAPIYTSNDLAKGKIHQGDLNDVLVPAMEQYGKQIKDAIGHLVKLTAKAEDLPIILTGGTSLLPGLDLLLRPLFPEKEFHFYCPRTIGARSPRYMALLGLLLARNSGTGSLSDNQKNLPHVSRPNEKPARRAKRAERPEEDAL